MSYVLRLAYVIADVTTDVIASVIIFIVLRPEVLPSYALLSCWFDVLSSYVLPLDVLQSYVLRTVVVHLVDLCPKAYLNAFCHRTIL
jgi:hypothetical protein